MKKVMQTVIMAGVFIGSSAIAGSHGGDKGKEGKCGEGKCGGSK